MTFRKAIALILILALLGGGGYYLLKTEREDDERMRNLYSEVEPLERERESLAQEKKNLETDYALKMRDYGTVEILFTTLDAQIFTDVWPVMRSRDIVGVLPLSFVEVPAYYNKLTAEQIRTLLADGWGLCVKYENVGGSFKNWYDALGRFLETMNLPAPTAVYFPNDEYDSETMDEELIECGIKTVIIPAENEFAQYGVELTRCGNLLRAGTVPGEGQWAGALRKTSEAPSARCKTADLRPLESRLQIFDESVPKVELDLQQALRYLHRDSLFLPDAPLGMLLACYRSHPLGLLKNLGSRCNNLYPKGRRILMDV